MNALGPAKGQLDRLEKEKELLQNKTQELQESIFGLKVLTNDQKAQIEELKGTSESHERAQQSHLEQLNKEKAFSEDL